MHFDDHSTESPPAPTPSTSLVDITEAADSLEPAFGAVLEWAAITYAIDVADQGHISSKLRVAVWHRTPAAPQTIVTQHKQSAGKKYLLWEVQGKARPREILAIMGGSGAGKTTLLDALAGRLRNISGTCLVNGAEVPAGQFGGFSKAYVFQGDCLHARLTVRETLSFAAKFQLDPKMSRDDRKALVERWLELLGLKHIEHVLVGDEDKKGISGGQKRRLSLGVDMLKDPKVLFLDEPISGLDSTSAFKVVTAIKRLAVENDCTVLMTIHQPSPRIMDLLDNILILSDGRVVFQGIQAEVTQYLDACGAGALPAQVSPIEFFLDHIDELHEHGLGIDHLVEYHRERTQLCGVEFISDTPPPKRIPKSHLNDFITLVHRSAIIILRTPDLLFTRLVFYAILGFLVATMFWSVGTSFQEVTEIAGFFVMAMGILTYSSLEVLPLFALERGIIQREYFQEAYSIVNYILAQSTVWTVTFIPIALVFTLTTYWSVGLQTDVNGAGTFLFTWLIWFSALFAANAFGMLLSALITSPLTGTSVGTACFDFMLMLGGFFIQNENIPKYWIWYHYISHFTYSQAGLLTNYFGNMPDTKFGCSPPYDIDPNCSLSGEQVLDYYGVADWNKWTSILGLLGFGLLWRVLHCIVLSIRFRNLRASE